ncbi:MAG: helix-turn-helix domain-containing protein, partial [Candidatus Omnitrophica bacterium]|nr:helix-turn-helix domain-containing protein [Candidatus Omnitrophota bacterium]
MEIHQICKILKETRKEKKITLEKASQLTKLTPLIIKKIEEADNLESMNQFYLKGFLKIYATSLGRKDLIEKIEKCFLKTPPPSKKTIKRENLQKLKKQKNLAGSGLLQKKLK